MVSLTLFQGVRGLGGRVVNGVWDSRFPLIDEEPVPLVSVGHVEGLRGWTDVDVKM